MNKAEGNINIKTSSKNVIAAFTNSSMLAEWWGVERTLIDLKIGDTYTLAWGISDNGIKYVLTGIIHEYKQVSLLRINNFTYLNFEKAFWTNVINYSS